MATQAPTEHETTRDQSLCATLSLYIFDTRLTQVFSNWNNDTREVLRSHAASRELQRAIDPLFNDVAVRDRNSRIDEFLLDLDGATTVQDVEFTVPDVIEWQTEGKKFRARIQHRNSLTMKCRSFWYAHTNGSLSFHLSFLVDYKHSFEDFYVLSMLQKLMFPKEFYVREGHTPKEICSGHTGVAILDAPMIRAPGFASDVAGVPPDQRDSMPFWTFVRLMASRQLLKLTRVAGLQLMEAEPPGGAPADAPAEAAKGYELWKGLVDCDNRDFIEVPGLKAPLARAVFLFQDRAFFELLQPGERGQLRDNNANYVARMPEGADDSDVVLVTPELLQQVRNPALPYHHQYYFLSGFFQNIIDFANQDVSELRDGTDPVYPKSDEQMAEALFVRFANSRGIYQVVKRSRSLEVGNDYIGTCPYIFLVHLMALHNEALVRDYELKTADAQKLPFQEVLARKLSDGEAAATPSSSTIKKRITEPFYELRYRVFTVFKQHLYENTFRYDTERDVFDALQGIRGTRARLERCDAIVKGLDATVKDLEEDTRYSEQQKARDADKKLSRLVALVGLFSISQAAFQAIEVYKKLFVKQLTGDGQYAEINPTCYWRSLDMGLVTCNKLDASDFLGLATMLLTGLGVIVVAAYVIYAAASSLLARLTRGSVANRD